MTAGDVIIGADSHTCTYGALGAFLHRSRHYGYGGRYGQRERLGSRCPSALKFELVGKPGALGQRQRRHPVYYRHDRRGWRSVPVHGVCRRGHLPTVTMDDRFTICNMAIEAGGKNGIFPVDDQAESVHAGAHSELGVSPCYEADPDAPYDDGLRPSSWRALRPTVVPSPHLPENTQTVGDLRSDIPVDQVAIGSCTNGRIRRSADRR